MKVTPARLVVIDDEADAGEVVSRVLELDGHQVTRSTDPGTAAGAADEADAVIIGAVTSDGGALALVRRLRDDGERVRIVLLGNREGAGVAAWSAGVDGFLVRPVDAQALRDEVATVLELDADERAARRASGTGFPA